MAGVGEWEPSFVDAREIATPPTLLFGAGGVLGHLSARVAEGYPGCLGLGAG